MIGTGSFATDGIFASGATTAYILIVVFAFGLVFGSFLNCMAWRIAHNESVLKGRSHCAVCGHVLGAADLVPVFSYLFLKGKCRYCGKKISPRYMIAELVCGALFVIAVLKWGISFETLRYVVLFAILFTLSLVDIEISIIPDRFIIAAIVWWVVTLPLMHESVVSQLKSGLIGAFVIAGAMLLMSLLFDKISGKESMGGGDIKLYFVCGLYLGPLRGFLCIILSCILGLLAAALLGKNRDEPFPFGPAIAVSCVICMLFGQYVVDWYLKLL